MYRHIYYVYVYVLHILHIYICICITYIVFLASIYKIFNLGEILDERKYIPI